MIRYITKRIFYLVPLLLGVTLVTFVLFDFVGGNPCLQLVGKHQSAEVLAQCEQNLGLDQPPWIRYINYLSDLSKFEFGRSFTTKQRVSEIILNGIGPSLSITVPAFVIGTLVALVLSLIVAYFRGQFIDRFGVFLCVIGMSVTVLAYIIFGQYVLAHKFALFPVSGWESGFNVIPYVALPVLIWVTVGLGYDVRFFRTCFLDETNQDYVRTARAKGLSGPVVFFKHVFKNALIPIITHVVIQIPFLITGSLLLENFFGIPGLGNAVIRAINDSDLPVLKAMVFIGALGFGVFHLLTDICYALVDPRVRFHREEA